MTLRYLTGGESHGRAIAVIVEGLPAGLQVTSELIGDELARRRLGFGRGPRQRFERDELVVLGGVRHGVTLGSPLVIEIPNLEWPKWREEMSPDPGRTEHPLTAPRPGHADLAGMQKYGFRDARNVLERASARETAARVAAGAVAKALLRHLGIDVLSHVIQMGSVRSKIARRPIAADLPVVDASPLRVFETEVEDAMLDEVRLAGREGDSLGGVVEVIAYGAPPGLGSHVHWDRRLDSRLAAALMSIQAVKAVEIGEGFDVASRRGSAGHDPIVWDADAGDYRRETALAGGIEGGMSTGEAIIARAAMKPLATLNRPVMKTVDVVTKREAVSFKERTDITSVPAMGVVAETMIALVLADEALRKFGGDTIDELVRNYNGYVTTLRTDDGQGAVERTS